MSFAINPHKQDIYQIWGQAFAIRNFILDGVSDSDGESDSAGDDDSNYRWTTNHRDKYDDQNDGNMDDNGDDGVLDKHDSFNKR